jgi:hypothetical protein
MMKCDIMGRKQPEGLRPQPYKELAYEAAGCIGGYLRVNCMPCIMHNLRLIEAVKELTQLTFLAVPATSYKLCRAAVSDH